MAESSPHLSDWFKALIENSSDVLVLVNIRAKILYTSPSTERVLGYKPTTLIGQNGLALVHPEDRPLARKKLASLILKPNSRVTAELRFRHHDGSWRYVEGIATNLLFHPVIHAIVINYRDITERKQLEQSKDNFLAIASHQLRTPVSGLRWILEMIQAGDYGTLSPTVATAISRAYGCSNNLLTLLNDLLSASRISQQRIQNLPQAVKVFETISEIVATMQPALIQKHVAVTIKTIPRQFRPILFIDQKLFHEILYHVFVNAIKYNRPHGKIICTFQQSNTNLKISVTDSGIGIPKPEQSKVFTSFFRASNATKLDPQGSGLGLFVVKSYVEVCNGKIDFKSTTRQGSTFIIHLPLPSDLNH